MTPTQKEAAITAFENMALFAKEVVDVITDGYADNVELSNDVAGHIVHAEYVLRRLRDFVCLGRPIDKTL